MSDVWRDQEDRRGRVEQVRENAARPGRAFAEYDTVGSSDLIAGTYEEEVFGFRTAFLSRPIFTYGMSVTEDEDEDWDPPVFVPYSSVIVYQWRKNAHGFYTGAWCGFRSTVPNDVKVTFSLVWEGIASKDFVASKDFLASELDA